jgi:hypothetical protein
MKPYLSTDHVTYLGTDMMNKLPDPVPIDKIRKYVIYLEKQLGIERSGNFTVKQVIGVTHESSEKNRFKRHIRNTHLSGIRMFHKYRKNQKKMKVIATALPSTRYRWSKSLENVKLEARLVRNQVRFYEIYLDKERCITEDLVKSLFPTDCRIVDRPFLAKENKEFYAVVRRHTVKYNDEFLKLKNGPSEQKKSFQLKRKGSNGKFNLKRG